MGWNINIKCSEELCERDPGCEAEIDDDLKYHEANLGIYNCFWEHTDERREMIIVHEMMHLVMCRLHPHISPSGDDIVEEVVQSVAMLFFSVYKNGII